MSEEIKKTEEEMQCVFAQKLCDADLLKFADIATRYDISVGLTLVCKGLVITGTTIGGKKYYESVAASFGPIKEGEVSFAQYFISAGESRYNPDEDGEIEINFIHLKNVAINSGNGKFVPLNGGFLRLKLEEIDGYIFGSATHS